MTSKKSNPCRSSRGISQIEYMPPLSEEALICKWTSFLSSRLRADLHNRAFITNVNLDRLEDDIFLFAVPGGCWVHIVQLTEKM